MEKPNYLKLFFVTAAGALMLFLAGCSKKKGINEYAEQLQINFPQEMELIHYNVHADFQDYSIQSIYMLSYNEMNDLLEDVYFNLCDSSDELDNASDCWQRCNDLFTFTFLDENKALKIEILLIADSNTSILSIDEIKY